MKINLPACRALIAVSLSGAMAPCAIAQSTNSPYSIGISQSVGHESNMLQLGDGIEAPPGFTKSDNLYSTALLASFDQTFGRQRAFATMTVRENRYANNDVFNNRSYTAAAGLNWSTVERISGSLTANASRSLQRFNTAEIALLTEKNLESVEYVAATANVGLVTRYSFDLGVNHRQVRNSLDRPAVQAREYDQDAGNMGIRWTASGALSLSVGASATKGRYPKFRTAADGSYTADRFTRNDLYVSANYVPTGASQLDLRLSNGKTRYDLNEQRNFSGTTGSLTWNWMVTGKIRLATVIARDTGQDSYTLTVPTFPGLPSISTLADYSQSVQTYRMIGEYAATAKISVTAAVSRLNRKLVRTTDNQVFADLRDNERTTLYAVGMRWQPLRLVSLGCDYSNEQRKAERILLGPLHNTSFSCFGQLTLQ